MIQLNYEDHEDKVILTLTGHAGYAPKGEDILCGCISGMYQMLLVGLEMYSDEVEITDAGFILKDRTPETISLIATFLASMRILKRQYTENIEIKERYF